MASGLTEGSAVRERRSMRRSLTSSLPKTVMASPDLRMVFPPGTWRVAPRWMETRRHPSGQAISLTGRPSAMDPVGI